MSNQYFLNGAEVLIPDKATVRVGVQPYRSSDQIAELRSTFHGAYLFKRRGRDNTLISVPIGRQDPIGDDANEELLRERPPLVASLAREAILKTLVSLERPVLVPRPIVFLSERSGDDLLAQASQGLWTPPDWLKHRVSYEVDTRMLNPRRDGPARVVLLCSVGSKALIRASCDRLLEAGVELNGRYVMREEEGGDPRFRKEKSLVGQVEEAGSSRLVVRKADGDREKISAQELYMEPRFRNYKACVRQLAGDVAPEVLDRLKQLEGQLKGGPQQFQRVSRVLEVFRTRDLELAQGVPFRIGPIINFGEGEDWPPDPIEFKKPVLVFDPGGQHTDRWNERGLRKFGPYDQSYFSPKSPRIAVVCEEDTQGQVEEFLDEMLNGVVPPGGGRKAFEEGFIRRFGLEEPEISIYKTADRTADSYRTACREAVRDAADQGRPWTLALVQIREEFSSYRGDENPYLVTKSTFMKRQTPVQAIRIEKISSPAYDRQFILNDLSLASYAKMGGIPWVMKANPGITHEVVMGLGRASFQRSRIGPQERHVGVATVFSGDGRYMLDRRTSAVPFEEYASVLKRSLEEVIATIREEQNWRRGEPVRIIVHAFKRLKNVEAEALREIIASLEHESIEYAFIHFSNHHPYILFDKQNVSERQGKGKYAPSRGTSVRLSHNQSLVSLVGGTDIKQEWAGIPTPAQLKLHRHSNFRDLQYLGRQVFRFACHSWRGFSPSPLPITLLYASRIARLLTQLKDVSDWDPDAMLDSIGRTPWYL